MAQDTNISDKTKVNLGLLILILGFCCGGAWWAATIKAQVDTLVSSSIIVKATQDKNEVTINLMQQRLEKMQWQINNIESKIYAK